MYKLTPPFPVCDVAMIPGLLLIFLSGCDTVADPEGVP